MDFQSLSRKDLQSLCKKNKIPANTTNVAMGNALQALEIVEGIEELQHLQSQPESPERTEERSPDLPRTCQRTSTRKIRALKDSVLSKDNETKDLLQSPVPFTRTHRGTAAKASTARRRVCKEKEPEKEESSDSQQILLENNGSAIPKTPAACNGRRRARGTSIQQKIETQVDAKENENPIAMGLRTSTRRSTRLSVKRLQETAPPSIQKSRGRKEVIKIAALSEESEESEVKLEEAFERSDPEIEQQDSSADLVLQKSDALISDGKSEDLHKIEDFNGEKQESDPIADDCESKKCDSEPKADAEQLPSTDDCVTDPSSEQNLVSGDDYESKKCDSESTADAGTDDCITDPSSDQNLVSGDAAAVLEDLKPENCSATEDQLLSDSVAGAGSDHELKSPNQVLQDCKESDADPDADADLDLDIDPMENLKIASDQEASEDMFCCEDLVASTKQNEKFGLNMIESDVELKTGSAIDLPKEEVESGSAIADSSSSGNAITLKIASDQEASEDVFCSEDLVESPKQNEKFGEDMIECDVEFRTDSTSDTSKEAGESGNAIADSSSSVGCLNPECENSDSEQLESTNLSSSMKNLTLDCQEQSVEYVASTEFSTQALIPDEAIPPKNKTMDSDCGCGNVDIVISSEIPDQSLIGTPASLRRNHVGDHVDIVISSEIPDQSLIGTPASLRRNNNVGVSRSGNLLGSKSHSKLRLSNKKATPSKSNILEDADKENVGGESTRRETKVNNEGADKEQQKGGGSFNDMSMRQLKKLYKDTKNEFVKRSALQAVNQNCQPVEGGK